MKYSKTIHLANSQRDLAKEGWTKVREPSMLVSIWLIGLPLGLLQGAICYGLLTSLTHFHIDTVFDPLDGWAIALILLALALTGPSQLLAHPRFGLSDKSLVGVIWKAGAIAALYDDPLPRNRALVATAMPLLLFTVVPLVLAVVCPSATATAGTMAIITALSAGALPWGIAINLSQIPAKAQVQNQGWASYWKV